MKRLITTALALSLFGGAVAEAGSGAAIVAQRERLAQQDQQQAGPPADRGDRGNRGDRGDRGGDRQRGPDGPRPDPSRGDQTRGDQSRGDQPRGDNGGRGWPDRGRAPQAAPEAAPQAPAPPRARGPDNRGGDRGQERWGDNRRGGDWRGDRGGVNPGVPYVGGQNRDRGDQNRDRGGQWGGGQWGGDRGRGDERARQFRDRDHGRQQFDQRRYRPIYRAPQRYRAPIYSHPRGYYARSWGFGDYLPGGWFGSSYYLDAWRYGLPEPPIGCEWVRVGQDALLVDVWTGEVLSVWRDLFW